MPKGGLLHAHLEATVDSAYMLKQALSFNGMHIRAPQIVTSSNIETVIPEFRVLPPQQFYASSSLTDVEYEPGLWIDTKHARETFDMALGGPKGFDAWLFGSLTINPNEAYRTHNSVLKVCGHGCVIRAKC